MSSGPRKADGFDGATSDHVVKILLYCTNAVTVGEAVQIDTANTQYGLGNSVKKAQASSADTELLCGIADATMTAAGDLLVQVSGLRTDVAVDSSVAAGEYLTNVGATAGRLNDIRDIIHTGFDLTRAQNAVASCKLAVSLSAESSNALTARLLDPMNLAH